MGLRRDFVLYYPHKNLSYLMKFLSQYPPVPSYNLLANIYWLPCLTYSCIWLVDKLNPYVHWQMFLNDRQIWGNHFCFVFNMSILYCNNKIILYYLDNCDINSSYPYESQWTNGLGNLSTSLDNPECYQHSLVTDGKTENPCPLTADPAPSSCVWRNFANDKDLYELGIFLFLFKNITS